MLPRALAVAVALLAGCGGPAARCALPGLAVPGPPFLWRVHRGDGPVLWLYGTIHDAGLDAVPPAARRALDGSRRFVSELGDSEPDPDEMRALARLPSGKGIDQQLPADDWWDLRDALLGVIKEDDLRRARPWYAMSLLTSHAAPSAGLEMDVALARRAAAHHLPVEALETWKAQLTALDAVVGIPELEEAIHARKTMRCDLARMRAAYLAGDTPTMEALLIIPHTASTLVWARNRAWLPALEKDLGDGGGFVAVGLAHLLGDQGLPALLAKDGYTVERVGAAPVTGPGSSSPRR